MAKKDDVRCVRNRKVAVCVAFIMTACISMCFAASGSGITVLDDFGKKLITLCQGTWLKALMAAAMMVSFGVQAWARSQGNAEMVTSALRVMFACGGILGATCIVNFFFEGVSVEELKATAMIITDSAAEMLLA